MRAAGVLGVIGIALSCSVRPAFGHGPLHEQIAALSARIDADPGNPTLYLRRGELEGLHANWEAALADFDRAAALAPSLVAVDLHRGKTLLRAGRPTEAKSSLDRFLARSPGDPDGRIARARALELLGEPAAASGDFGMAVSGYEALGLARPEHYLQWAHSFLGSKRPVDALRALDTGISRFGPIVSLQQLAIDLELASGRPAAALARIDALASISPRPEPWLLRKGEVLELSGRGREARLVYEDALLRLKRLPRKPRVVELESKALAALSRVSEESP